MIDLVMLIGTYRSIARYQRISLAASFSLSSLLSASRENLLDQGKKWITPACFPDFSCFSVVWFCWIVLALDPRKGGDYMAHPDTDEMTNDESDDYDVGE